MSIPPEKYKRLREIAALDQSLATADSIAVKLSTLLDGHQLATNPVEFFRTVDPGLLPAIAAVIAAGITRAVKPNEEASSELQMITFEAQRLALRKALQIDEKLQNALPEHGDKLLDSQGAIEIFRNLIRNMPDNELDDVCGVLFWVLAFAKMKKTEDK